MEEYRIHKRSRSKHRRSYWEENDKSEYNCPECSRGLGDVFRFEVHHKDGDPTNGNPENLIGLCRRCHYEEHGKTPPETLEEWKSRVEQLGN